MKKTLIALLAFIAVVVALMAVFPEQTTRLAFRAERAMSGLEYRTIQVDGQSWHYLVGGPEDGETILLLHGFGGEKDNWNRFLRHLADEYRVVVPDLPGFGESARHAEWDYSLVPQRERVHGFAATIGLTRFHLVGHSMGGHLSILYALEHPEQLVSLTLVNSAGITSPNESEFARNVSVGKNDLVVRSRDEFESMLTMVFEEAPFAPWPMKKALAARMIANADFNEAVFTSLRRNFEPGLEKKLPDIVCPILILWGDNDRIIDVSSVAVMRDALPHADVVIMEGVGHMPILERPRETAGYYRAFLQKL